jgi:uncharacterized protein (DUF2062 family)
LWHWFDPRPTWRSVRASPAEHHALAAGIAVGVFIANLPLYPLQTVISLGVAKGLRLHPLSVVAGSQVSTPPMGFVLIGAAVWLGDALLGNAPVGPAAPASLWAVPGRVLLTWSVGGMVLGAVLAPLCYVAARMLFRSLCRGDGAR